MQEKKKIDWERIEVDYRAGIKTLRDIAAEHSISHGAITKRCKRDGWVRDLSAKIEAKAAELVAKSVVSKEASKNRRILESEIINANAVTNSDVVIVQRNSTSASTELIDSLLQELKGQIENKADLEHLGEMMRNPDAYGNDKLNDVYIKTISFAGRVDSAKKIIDAQKVSIELQRKVYKIDTDTAQGGVEDFLKKFRNV